MKKKRNPVVIPLDKLRKLFKVSDDGKHIYHVTKFGHRRRVKTVSKKGYLYVNKIIDDEHGNGGTKHVALYVHRIMYALCNNVVLYKEVVRHVDGNLKNNHKDNLVLLKRGEHLRYRSPTKRSKTNALGVYPIGKRFKCSICVDNKPTYVGTYDTIEEAAQARLEAYVKLDEEKLKVK